MQRGTTEPENRQAGDCLPGPPFSAPDLELYLVNVLTRQDETQAHDQRYDIHVHSRRHRFADSDGISAKAAIDGAVIIGLLPDDSPEEVRQTTYSQAKIPANAPEITIIRITPVREED